MIKLITSFLLIFLCSSIAFAQSDFTEETVDEDGQIVEETLEVINEESEPPREAPYVDYEVEVENNQKKTKAKRKARQAINRKKALQVKDGDGRVVRRYIKHPGAKRGLYKITKEGTYLYRVKPSERKGTAMVRFSVFNAPNFVNDSNGATYNDIYGGNDVIAFFDWEMDFAIPNMSLKFGSGIHVATGNGKLEDGQDSKEEFTLIMLPNNVALSYKLKFGRDPWFYPYVEGGAGAFVFTERRDDNEPPLGRWGAAFNVHAVAGVAFSLTALSRDTALRLDSEYGINAIYLTVDAKQLIGFGTFDTTSTLFNAGLSVEY